MEQAGTTEKDAFTAYLNEQVENHSIYVWGAQGQKAPTVSQRWIESRETSAKNARRAVAFWKKQVQAGYGALLRAFDCSGLLVYYLLQNGLIGKDMTADGLMGLCTPIAADALGDGDLVFRIDKKGKAYHVGAAVDGGEAVVEAKGRSYGVVKSAPKGWSVYARPPFFTQKSRLLRLAHPLLRGSDVRMLQTALRAAGFFADSADGIFGKRTAAAVRSFQRAKGLKVDGIAGPDTFAALGLSYIP